MKYKEITIIDVPVKDRLQKLGVSVLQLGKDAGVDTATMHYALNDELILSERTARKIIEALENLETNPVLVEEKIKITKKSNKGSSVVTDEEKLEMVEFRKQGKTLQEIGIMFYGLTKERVRQITKLSYVDLRRMGVNIKRTSK